jgi:hypothetical protein
VSIGQKGMIVAAKALAATGADLFVDRQRMSDAKADFRKQINGHLAVGHPGISEAAIGLTQLSLLEEKKE